MRWAKCLVLSVGHILITLSMVFITVSEQTMKNDRQHHFMKWFGIILGTGSLAVISGAYLIAMPVTLCMRKRKILTYLTIVITSIVYFICLSFMLWGLQHIVVHATALACYSMSGQIGLVFGILILYDSMRGESTKDLYERVLTELDEEMDEFGHDTTRCGVTDTDIQRDNV